MRHNYEISPGGTIVVQPRFWKNPELTSSVDNQLCAIRESIHKWITVAKYCKETIDKKLTGERILPVTNSGSCALCWLNLKDDSCTNCPIYNYTGRMYCDGTPYELVAILNNDNFDEMYKASLREIEFLREIYKDYQENHRI